MGDQVGQAVGGTLYYVPYKEFARVREMPLRAVEKTRLFAALCRINTLYMIARAGSGHIGSSFSSMEIMCWMQLHGLRTGAKNDPSKPRDVFFSSKGHDSPALYNTWIGTGVLDFNLLHRLRRLDGLPGHPDMSTPNVVTNTGSLGMGVSKAKGMVMANRLRNREGNVFVLTGDGELQEGQFWESLISAANRKMHELTVIIDHNKLQSDTLVEKVSDLGDLNAKLASFGWHVQRCDGNDVGALSRALAAGREVTDRPKAIIADTIKGKGVSFMEHTACDSDVELYKFHSGAPSEEAYVRAVQELIDAAKAGLATAGAGALELETVVRPSATPATGMQRLIPAYSAALIRQARANPGIVALDADLVLDTGLIPFRDEFPDRFIECGIAEQDMVSQAGGMALEGLLPVVHSFACFLSARPNEQIYNNATERTKIIYVGSLAGVLPAGPGHSHQAVRDISSLAAVPGLSLVEPSCEAEVDAVVDWAVNANASSTYIRLTSIPCAVPYELPAGHRLEYGRGTRLTDGTDAAVIAYGPVMLSGAFEAADILRRHHQLAVRVINLPWLNAVDAEWLAEAVKDCRTVFSIDNHYLVAGQGDRIASALAAMQGPRPVLHRLGVGGVPACGSNAEVLQAEKLDVEAIAAAVLKEVSR